jgi:hypothetical protein
MLNQETGSIVDHSIPKEIIALHFLPQKVTRVRSKITSTADPIKIFPDHTAIHDALVTDPQVLLHQIHSSFRNHLICKQNQRLARKRLCMVDTSASEKGGTCKGAPRMGGGQGV